MTIVHFFFRCDKAGLAGKIRLAAVRCPAGLAFDIDRQTCDWKAKVENCDRLSSEWEIMRTLHAMLATGRRKKIRFWQVAAGATKFLTSPAGPI